MAAYDNCSNCFNPKGGQAICPHCGHNPATEKPYTCVLPAFTVLNGRYLLGRVLGKGGFGITYIAKDMMTNGTCAIKEYMPAEYSTRSNGTQNVIPFSDDKAQRIFNHGKEKFLLEAQTLLSLRNDPIVVDILDYFSANNTAYLVMEFLDGQDLRKMARANGGQLEPEFAKTVFVTIASSLMEIHRKNILHRDLSPENIIVTKSGQIKLIDFGAARNFVSTQNKGMSILLKPGFAPPEQYSAKGKQGPWSDVYALCATFYTLVSGKPLVDALFRYRGETQPSLSSLGCAVTKKTSDVIERGMELELDRRYKDFKQLLDDIDISVSKETTSYAGGGMSGQANGQVNRYGGQSAQTNGQVNRYGGQSAQTNGQVNRYGGQSAQTNGQVNRYGGQSAQTNGQANYYGGQSAQANGQANYYGGQSAQTNGQVNRYGGQQIRAAGGPQPYVAAVVGKTLCNKVAITTNDICKIGRSPQSCQYIVSGDTNISRIHCYVRYDGNRLYLTDSSANGTFFENGTQLLKNREYAINPGTKFYLATRNHMFVVNI